MVRRKVNRPSVIKTIKRVVISARRRKMKKAVPAEVLVQRLLSKAEYVEFEKHSADIDRNRAEYYDKTSIAKLGWKALQPFRGLELKIGQFDVKFFVTKTSGQFYYAYQSQLYGWRYVLIPEARNLAEAVASVVSDPDNIAKSSGRADCGQQRWISKQAAQASGRPNVTGSWMFSGQM